MTQELQFKIPLPPVPFIDPDGQISRAWLYVMQQLQARTGGSVGISVAAVADTANTALATGNAAQSTANTALTVGTAAQAAATAAQTTANAASAATAAETARALAAEALLAPKNSPIFTGAAPIFALFGSYANDAAAAGGGISIGQLYNNTTAGAVAQRRV